MSATDFQDVVNSNEGPFGGYAKTLFVGSNSAGYQTAADGLRYDNPAPTLASILRNGVVDTQDRGTRIVLRRGHTESISAADFFSLQAARKRIHIIGEGDGVEKPTFTWTANDASWLLDTDSMILENLRLLMAGPHAAGTARTVAAPMTISGAGCALRKIDGLVGFDADQIVTIGITTTDAADDLTLEDVHLVGESTAECTTVMQIVGCARLRMRRVSIKAATSAVGVGVLRFLTTASTDIDIENLKLQHKKAASETAFTGMAGLTGFANDVHLGVLANAAAQLVIGGANSALLLPGNLQFGDRLFVTNTVAERAALMTPVSA